MLCCEKPREYWCRQCHAARRWESGEYAAKLRWHMRIFLAAAILLGLQEVSHVQESCGCGMGAAGSSQAKEARETSGSDAGALLLVRNILSGIGIHTVQRVRPERAAGVQRRGGAPPVVGICHAESDVRLWRVSPPARDGARESNVTCLEGELREN